MAKYFLLNIMLSFIWVALTGSLYYSNFVFGFGIGFLILWLMNSQEDDRRYFNKVPKTIRLTGYFLYKMMTANIQVAYDVITPRYFFTPGIIQYPLDAETDIEINLLSTMISMTPGTLILDISEDKKSLFIHVMYLNDKELVIADIKNGLEHKLLEILR